MDNRLVRLIADYQQTVADAIALLKQAGIAIPASNVAWTAMDLPNGEFLPGYKMFKHGFGCSVKGPAVNVDFDFGNAGQTNGFDIGRLQAFASRSSNLYGFETLAEIRECFNGAIAQGEISVDTDSLSYLL
jgi:hypothetical protein